MHGQDFPAGVTSIAPESGMAARHPAGIEHRPFDALGRAATSRPSFPGGGRCPTRAGEGGDPGRRLASLASRGVRRRLPPHPASATFPHHGRMGGIGRRRRHADDPTLVRGPTSRGQARSRDNCHAALRNAAPNSCHSAPRPPLRHPVGRPFGRGRPQGLGAPRDRQAIPWAIRSVSGRRLPAGHVPRGRCATRGAQGNRGRRVGPRFREVGSGWRESRVRSGGRPRRRPRPRYRPHCRR